MMIIDIRKLNAQKQYAGEMEISYSAPEELIPIPFCKFEAPILVKFHYDLYEDNAFEVRGIVKYRLVGQCSRCLESASADVEGELDALFEQRKDSEDYSYANGKVDLTDAVNDAIMASMPFALSCGDNCQAIEIKTKD